MSASCSMFSQILKLVPRIDFERMVKQTNSEYAAKGMSSWSQFVAMMFCQLGRAHSLREIEGGLKSCEGKLAHLGIEAPAKSSLSYANAHRPWELYQKLFYSVLNTVSSSVTAPRKFRFKNKLVSVDSTTIDLCLSVFDWAKFRRTKGAVKLHLVLDHDGYLPCYAVITEGNVHDVKVAWQIPFPAGTVVVDDRGYNDYRLFSYWSEAGVYFVTRMKDNARFEVVEQRAVPHHRGIVRDQIIRLSGMGAEDKCAHLLRRVEAVREDTGETLVFLTNHYKLGASTVAAIYKDRWAVELFFKALKQNLKIKTFVGTSSNAVKTQSVVIRQSGSLWRQEISCLHSISLLLYAAGVVRLILHLPNGINSTRSRFASLQCQQQQPPTLKPSYRSALLPAASVPCRGALGRAA